MSKAQQSSAVLGVYVGPETIEAVLLRDAGDHVNVVQRFVRQRTGKAAMATSADLSMALPGMRGSDDSDYTLEVGDGSASGTPAFLPSELGNLGGKGKAGEGKVAVGPQPKPFASQLKDILQECFALGYEHPAVVFCIAPPDVSYVELALPLDEAARQRRKAGKSDPSGGEAAERKRLLALLPQHYTGTIPQNQVTFLPLVSDPERKRFLALVPEPTEPVAPTLQQLRDQDSAVAPTSRALDAEASLYASVLARTLKPEADEQTAIVRVGANDTVVHFFGGSTLRHIERLRSLTSYDPAETICSRVLLQQDEKRIGKLHNVFVVSSGRADQLLATFRQYYPDAAVEPVSSLLTDTGIRLPDDAEAFEKAGTVAALAVALRQAQQWEVEHPVNLLPNTLKRRKKGPGVAWHSVVAVLVVIAAVGLTVLRHQEKTAEIEALRMEYRMNPLPPLAMSPERLQARVDSLDRVYVTYTRALTTLDELLVGSDRYISTLERVSRAVAAEPETWVNSFTPQGGTSAELTGHALSRLAIVDLSRRLNGAIQSLTFQDIGQRRVYNYKMTIPIEVGLPRAALYLRNIAEGEASPAGPMEVHPARHAH